MFVKPLNTIGGEYVTKSLLNNLIDFLAPVAAIGVVLFCLFQVFKIVKGSEGGTVKRLVGGVLLFFFIIGIMYAAGSFQTYGQIFQSLTDKAINRIDTDVDRMMGR